MVSFFKKFRKSSYKDDTSLYSGDSVSTYSGYTGVATYEETNNKKGSFFFSRNKNQKQMETQKQMESIPEEDAGRDDVGAKNVSEDVRTDVASTSSGKSRSVIANLMRSFSSDSHAYEHSAVTFDQFGEDAVETLRLTTYSQIPTPNEPNDVVVKVKSSTVSFDDIVIRRGMWYESIDIPNTTGFDCVGEVVTVGKTVEEDGTFKKGDRVAAIIRTGGNARYATVPAASLVRVPKGVENSEAACIVKIYMTAYQALRQSRPNVVADKFLDGANVLITGGNGATGYALIQLAKHAGADTVYTTALNKYHTELRSIGAVPLPIDESMWLPYVKGQMDVVVDSICQDDYKSPQEALNKNGRLVCTGMAAIINREEPGWFGMPADGFWASMKAKFFMGNTTVYDTWQSFQKKPDQYKNDMETLFDLVSSGQIRTKVSERVPLDSVADAQRRLQEGKIDKRGVIICKPWK